MTQRRVHRPARIPLREIPLTPIDLPGPPPDSHRDVGAWQVLLLLFGVLGSAVMVVGNHRPLLIVAGGIMLGAMVVGGMALYVAQRTGRRLRSTELRNRYLEMLDQVGDDLVRVGAWQREVAEHRHPAPEQLLDVIRDPTRLWERRRSDVDFLVVRIGAGQDQLRRQINVISDNPKVRSDPLAQASLARLLRRKATLNNMPMAVPLAGSVSLVGPRQATRALLRVLLVQLAVLHAPDDVRVGLCIGVQDRSEFEAFKWLPHLLDPSSFDGPVARLLVARSIEELADLLNPELLRRSDFVVAQRRHIGATGRLMSMPRLVVVVDQPTAPDATPLNLLQDSFSPEALGLTVVTVAAKRQHEPVHVDVRVTCDERGHVKIEDLRSPVIGPDKESEQQVRRIVAGASAGKMDFVAPPVAFAIARQLAPLRLFPDAELEAPLEANIDLSRLVGVEDVGDYNISRLWAPRPLPDFLRVPFGLNRDGQKVFLDLKEAAQGGMGPHGLCLGATGSGKSEILRTVVLTLAMTHPPERLGLVLVDYKGGTAFAGLEQLPHTAAMVTSFGEDSGLVDRLRDAIEGEIGRRHQLLLAAGSLPNTTVYNDRRAAGQDLPPMPNLFVVIDEFGELLTTKPDFIELFLQIGRIGRSLGIHLLLASQRLEEGRLRGLESYLSYRLGLRTFSEQESRIAIGVPDAYELPALPGSGYLKVDDARERFKAAYVSGTYRPATAERAPADLPPRLMPYGLFNDTAGGLDSIARPAEADPQKDDTFAPSVLDVVAGRLSQAAEQIQQIWLPPLPASLPLSAVVGDLVSDAGYGLTAVDPGRRGRFRIPVGMLDKPTEHWQGPFELDLSGAGGNVAIVGAPRSGKSTALRSLIASTVLTQTPTDVAFYCLDFGQGSLTVLGGLPHVGGVTSRLDPDRVRRTVAEVATQLGEREQLFAKEHLDSVEAMRAAHRAGRLPDLPAADVFLVIDNWHVLKEDFEDQLEIVHEIASRGLGFGVHLAITAGRWADLRPSLQPAIGTKIELRLDDPIDTVDTSNRRALANIRPHMRGRFVVSPGLTGQLCLPRIDGSDDPISLQEGLHDLVKQVSQAWRGNPVPEIRMLPTDVNYSALRQQYPEARPALLGLDEAGLRPVSLDLFGSDQHLIAFGGIESGKTNLARLIVRELVNHYSDEQVVFAVFDLRRNLLKAVPEPYLGGYAGTLSVATGLAASVAQALRDRLPSDDVTPTELANRSWWKGPEIIVLADDFDLLSLAGPGPLAPFLEFLPQSRDIGLHLVLLRRSDGAARALYQPVIQSLRELGATGLLLSGDRQEGQLWPGAHLEIQPPGRGLLVRRGHKPFRLQLAHVQKGSAQIEEAPRVADRFHVGDAQGRPVGREDVLAWLRDRHATRASAALLGPRRAGKTWVLAEMSRRLRAAGARSVYQLVLPIPTTRVETNDALAAVLDQSVARSASPAMALRDKAERHAVTNDPLVFLLDEVGRLAKYNPAAVSWLRDLGQAGAWLLYTGTEKDWHTVVRWALTAPGSSFGNDVNARELGPWDEATALTFIAGTAANLGIDLSSNGTGKVIVELVGTWPFYLQVAGDAVVSAVQGGDFHVSDHKALRTLVERRLIDEWAAHFEGRWAEIDAAGRSALLAVPGASPQSLSPAQRIDLRDVGILRPGDQWLIDPPFFAWIARNAASLHDREM